MTFGNQIFCHFITLLLLAGCESTIKVNTEESKAAEQDKNNKISVNKTTPSEEIELKPTKEPTVDLESKDTDKSTPELESKDTEKPHIVEIKSLKNEVHLIGDQITLEVKFNEPIVIDEQTKPKLSFDLYSQKHELSFIKKIASDTIQFQSEKIIEGMNAYNGITLNNKIINSTSIKDASQNVAEEIFELPDLSSVSISTPWVKQFGLNNPIIESITNDGDEICYYLHIDKDGNIICLGVTTRLLQNQMQPKIKIF